MTVDPAVVPGLLLLALEFGGLAAVGYVVARVALRQDDDAMALAQGLVIGPALWGLTVNFVLHLTTGRAGALLGWILVLAVAVGLALRGHVPLRLSLRPAALMAAGWLALFWVVLASRQTLSIPDTSIHLGLASYIRAGGYPPTLPWNPGQPLSYHYGMDLLVGLLAPPVGPDLAFTTELVGVYVWIGLIMVVATALWERGSGLAALVVAPLLITAGAWTLVATMPSGILQIPVLAGLPEPGLRLAVSSLFWPEVSIPWPTRFDATPPNIWKPSFVLAYALAFVVLERASRRSARSWRGMLTIGAVIAFLGQLDQPMALVTLGLWASLETWLVVRSGGKRSVGWRAVGRAASGPALALLLLVAGGGLIVDLLFGSSKSGLSVNWFADAGTRLLIGEFNVMGGGLGVLSVGPISVALIALLLARDERLVLVCAAGCGAFILAALMLQYAPAPQDVTRFDGHARNLALLGLMVALCKRLARLQPRQRYVTAALVIFLVTWPTTVAPVRGLAQAFSHGIHLANTQPAVGEADSSLNGRYALMPLGSDVVAAHIRDHTSVDSRILSPHPEALTTSTGRPNASGFPGLVHLHPKTSPEYLDAIHFLEPTAVRRLGITHVHASDAWVMSLPDRARRRLNDPSLFEPLVRDGAHTLYRVQSEFLQLDTSPAEQSFEALRRAVPGSATVYLSRALHRLDNARLASVLAHTQLYGEVDPTGIHLLTEIPAEPLDERLPDIVLIPQGADAFLDASIRTFPPMWREPVRIWQSQGLRAYSKSPALAVDSESADRGTEASFSVFLSEVYSHGGTVNFAATFTNRASQYWTGQDWLVIRVDETPWALPISVNSDRYTIAAGEQWFSGQVVPAQQSARYNYQFNPNETHLEAWGPEGGASVAESSGAGLGPGVWALAVRLRHGYLQAAVVPVLTIRVFESGAASFTTYEGELTVVVNSCPQQLQDVDSCRRLAAGSSATPAESGVQR